MSHRNAISHCVLPDFALILLYASGLRTWVNDWVLSKGANRTKMTEKGLLLRIFCEICFNDPQGHPEGFRSFRRAHEIFSKLVCLSCEALFVIFFLMDSKGYTSSIELDAGMLGLLQAVCVECPSPRTTFSFVLSREAK